MKLLGKMVLAAALSLVSLPAFAHDRPGRHEHCPRGHAHAGAWRGAPARARREVWVPGHWVRHGRAHVWVEAHWTTPPQPAWIWVDRGWVRNGDAWRWQDAHWAPPS